MALILDSVPHQPAPAPVAALHGPQVAGDLAGRWSASRHCDCGRRPATRVAGGWACARCLELEARRYTEEERGLASRPAAHVSADLARRFSRGEALRPAQAHVYTVALNGFGWERVGTLPGPEEAGDE